jgi:hypothetical protein
MSSEAYTPGPSPILSLTVERTDISKVLKISREAQASFVVTSLYLEHRLQNDFELEIELQYQRLTLVSPLISAPLQ